MWVISWYLMYGDQQILKDQQPYFNSFTDAKSRYSTIYFSHTKDDVLDRFKDYKTFIEIQLKLQLKRLHSDGGSEYTNTAFKSFCAGNGIIMEYTVPYSPAQNGIAERLNHTLLEHTHTMIFAKHLPKILWAEAACYIKNRSPPKCVAQG
jgi:transposase InsO family protein